MMMALARLDVLHTYTRQELGLDDDVVDESLGTRNTMIDALKLFSYLGEDSRKKLIAVLFVWLSDDPRPQTTLSKEIFDGFEAEIDSNWGTEQRSSRNHSR